MEIDKEHAEVYENCLRKLMETINLMETRTINIMGTQIPNDRNIKKVFNMWLPEHLRGMIGSEKFENMDYYLLYNYMILQFRKPEYIEGKELSDEEYWGRATANAIISCVNSIEFVTETVRNFIKKPIVKGHRYIIPGFHGPEAVEYIYEEMENIE